MKINAIDEVIEASFGQWIGGLFHNITASDWNPSLTFLEHKEAFFWLLEKLLREGKIKFVVPNEFWKDQTQHKYGYVSTAIGRGGVRVYGDTSVWNADIPTIIAYLRSKWPASATHENDRQITDYLFDIPWVLWVDKDGFLHGS